MGLTVPLLPYGDLVGDEAEDRVGDVAVDAGGEEVEEVQVDEGDGECAVDDLAVDLRREQSCRRLVGRVEGDRALDLVVEPGVAEPAVAVRVRGGAAEVVGEEVDRVGVETADPGDVDAWTRVLGEAIGAGAERRASMGRAAMARARALYSVEAMCDATLKVYAGVLARRR